MEHVLIAGCGYVGSALAERLAASEAPPRITALRRSDAPLPGGTSLIRGDVSAPLPPLPQDIDTVVYCVSAGGSTVEAYERAYICGVRNCLDALGGDRQSLPRFVFVSSTGVYGQADGEWVDETTEPKPQSVTGRALLRGEELLRDRVPDAVIVRFGGIYGPGRTRLLNRLRQSRPGPADATRFSNRIHRDDCAGVLQHLVTIEQPDQLYLGVDSDPASRQTVLDWMASEGLQLPEPIEPPPVRASRHGSNKRCSNLRLQQSGYTFAFPTFRDGYRALIEETTG
jgi:nucleoside-diphosphate-sugar epimerase